MGIASLKVPFSLGINNISWSFISPNYYSCSGSETYEVSPIHLDLNITVLEDFNNAFVTFTFSQPITENVTLSVNGVNRTVEVVNGTFHLNFTDLDYGEYNIAMCVLREIYDCQNSTAFFVNVKRTYLNVSDFKTVYNGGEVYAIQLLDEFGIPLEGAQIRYILNNVTYFNSTDSNGVIYVPIDLQTGNYTISVFFDGDDTHVKCQNSSNITVDKSRTSVNITSVAYDSFDLFNICVGVLDQFGNVPDCGEIMLEVNGRNFTVSHGESLRVPLVLGKNNISAAFVAPNYYESSQEMTFEVLPIPLAMNITVLQDFNNAFVNFTLSQPINENVSVSVNGVNQTVGAVNGSFYLELKDLEYGDNTVSASVLRDIYDCHNSTVFFVNVKRTYLNVSDFKTVYNGGEVYAIQLLDEFGIPLEGAQIRYILNNVTYFNSTDSNGVIYVPIDLQTGNYTISVFFDGDDTHVKCQNSSNITVDKSRTSVNITSVAYDSFDLFNICVGVLDQFGNVPDCGEIMLEVNGRNFTVSHGESLRVPLVLGKNNISAAFVAPNYYESSQEMTFEVLPIPLAMNITVLQDFNNAFVNFTLSQPINENVSVSVNGVNQTVGAVNGSFYLELKDLEYGDNTVSAFVVRDIYDCHNSTVFFVNVKRTYIEAKDFETVYNSGMMYSVRLYDEFNMSVANRQIEFIVGDNVYFNTTDENGIASIAVSLKNSAYPVAVSFKGDDLYIKSQNSSLITVKSSISLPQNSNYAMNSNYVFSLTNRYGNPLADSVVSITVSDKTYDVETDANGKAIFEIPFSSGSFKITVENPETGEKLSQDIVVSKRITENVDMSFYYGKNPSFKVRVCDDSGNFVSGIIVKFKVNGKSYEVSSDNDGWAGIKIKLNVGKYTVTAEHKGFKVSNKINVKTTLITKNKKFKKAKTIKYTAKLLNKNGKAYKGKKITFKIKGKIYKAKTNSKGIATIKIKNLRVGKYKVTAKFSKLTSTSKITIKK